MRQTGTCLAAALLAGAALAWPAREAGGEGQEGELDYAAIREALPTMKDLSDRSEACGRKLHVLMDRLDTTEDEEVRRATREEIRALLEEYLPLKYQMIDVTKRLLAMKPSGLTDQQVVDTLEDTELYGIHWEAGTTFRKAIGDLSRAIGIPIRMQERVVQMNTLELHFPKAPAKTILSTLCNGFDLRWIVYGGEIVIYKKITPTEERFLDYQKRHPEAKLKYWEREDASGEYKKEKK